MDNIHSIRSSEKIQSKPTHSSTLDLQDQLCMVNFKANALANLAADDEFLLFAQDTCHGCLLALRDLVIESNQLSEQLRKHYNALSQNKAI